MKLLRSDIQNIVICIHNATDTSYLKDIQEAFLTIQKFNNEEKIFTDITSDVDVLLILLRELIADEVINKTEIEERLLSIELKSIDINDIDDDSFNMATKKFKDGVLNKIKCGILIEPLERESQHVVKFLDSYNKGALNIKPSNIHKHASGLKEHILNMSRIVDKMMIRKTTTERLTFGSEMNTDTFITLTEKLMSDSLSGSLKTIPAIDDMFGGHGIFPGLHVVCARPSHGKTLFALNLAYYAGINNDPHKISHVPPGKKPCILIVSLELTLAQLLERHYAFFGYNLATVSKNKEAHARAMYDMNKQMKIPIKYIVKQPGVTPADVRKEIEKMMSEENEYPVMCIVDYIDRMACTDSAFRSKGGASEKSQEYQMIASDCRVIALDYSMSFILPAQLDNNAAVAISQCSAEMHRVDPVNLLGEDNIGKSKYLQAESDMTILLVKSVIQAKDQIGKFNSFISVGVIKDRFNKALSVPYKMSPIEEENMVQSNRLTNQLKVDPKYKYILKEGVHPAHLVIPLEGIRLSGDTYAKSIRTYYPTMQSDYSALKGEKIGSLAKGEVDNSLFEEDEFGMN